MIQQGADFLETRVVSAMAAWKYELQVTVFLGLELGLLVECSLGGR